MILADRIVGRKNSSWSLGQFPQTSQRWDTIIPKANNLTPGRSAACCEIREFNGFSPNDRHWHDRCKASSVMQSQLGSTRALACSDRRPRRSERR